MNCIIIDDDKLSLKILEDFVKKTETLELVGTYDNAIAAINYLQKENSVDLIFLDIEMPEMTGFAVILISDSILSQNFLPSFC